MLLQWSSLIVLWVVNLKGQADPLGDLPKTGSKGVKKSKGFNSLTPREIGL